MAICIHCRKKPVSRPRSLCWECYQDPAVACRIHPKGRQGLREDNRRGMPHTAAEPGPRPERKPGEPEYRCLWCFQYRCRGPMQQCSECREEYNRMAVTMPGRGEGS